MTTNDIPPSQPLERRPDARTFSIQDLLEEVRRGKVRVPNFQRPLRWERDNAKRLLDSLYRGYPIGTLLFWETHAPAAEVRFGSLTLSASERSDALLVVDGQQRIVSLARTLLPSEPEKDAFALYFDLEDPGFVAPPTKARRAEDPSRWLPMTEVLDSERLIQWLLEHASGRKERREKAIQLGRRIREYDVPAYVVSSDDEAILRDIFKRINDSGKTLEASDVFDALNGARSANRPATIPEVSTDLERLEFGRVEEKVLYRLLRVLQGWDIAESAKEEAPRLNAEDAEDAYRATVAAATNAILFLKSDAGIPHYDLLPYKLPFVILGKFFQHHPTPSPRSRSLLTRWIWRGALNATHRGDIVSTRQTLGQIVANSEEQSVAGMLAMVNLRPSELPNVLDKFNFRFASSKLLALALISLGPRDLETGQLLESGALLDQAELSDEHGALPKIVTTGHDRLKELLQSAANRLMHPRRAALRQLLARTDNPEVLLSHGIPKESIDALHRGDVQGFLSFRSEWLRPRLIHFFDQQARWEESDRPAISSLIVDDEED